MYVHEITRDSNVVAENKATTRGNEATEEDELCHLPRIVFPGAIADGYAHRHRYKVSSCSKASFEKEREREMDVVEGRKL